MLETNLSQKIAPEGAIRIDYFFFEFFETINVASEYVN